MYAINHTHDPSLKSWVQSANQPGTDFPIQNLPFAIFRRVGTNESFRGGVAIGDQILDLDALHQLALLKGTAATALTTCTGSSLNAFMALGRASWSALRSALSEMLRANSPFAMALSAAIIPQATAEYALPAKIGNYTDFYASIYHATTVGSMFRPDSPLLANYKWLPIAYHGRASSICVSGQAFHRPRGQTKTAGNDAPSLEPSTQLDYELEVGILVGCGNALGKAVPMDTAEDHIFGLCLLNDWSARDIQAWEYQPLGPFLAKNFATTISPWIVTLEALAPFRAAWTRSTSDPQPLPYLSCAALQQVGAIDIALEVQLETQRMRAQRIIAERLSISNFKHCYWTIAQMLAHHTVGGCNLETGDLLGSGTQSGPAPNEAGSLLELTQGGQQPIKLRSGETRGFLADGDRVIFRGTCTRDGYVDIGFGEVSGIVLPARSSFTD